MTRPANPKYNRTDRPQIMACQVNAVNPHGTMDGALCRDAAGRLGALTHDYHMFGIPEMEYTQWLKQMQAKYYKDGDSGQAQSGPRIAGK